MTLEIKKYPNAILKKKAEIVEEVTPGIKELIFNMIETLRQAQGVGLAAPQVGISKRVIIVQTETGPQAYINPKILEKSRKTDTKEEGCLCFPGLFLKIKRAKEAEIEALNESGEKVKIQAEGILARIFQHEIDHLNGILILDKVSFWQRLKLKRKLKDYGLDR